MRVVAQPAPLSAWLAMPPAIVPDEAIAVGAASATLMTAGKTAAIGEYAKTRPISRFCKDVDDEANLIEGKLPTAVVGFGMEE